MSVSSYIYSRGIAVLASPRLDGAVVTRLALGSLVLGWPTGLWIELQASVAWVDGSQIVHRRFVLVDGSLLGGMLHLAPHARYRGDYRRLQSRYEADYEGDYSSSPDPYSLGEIDSTLDGVGEIDDPPDASASASDSGEEVW